MASSFVLTSSSCELCRLRDLQDPLLALSVACIFLANIFIIASVSIPGTPANKFFVTWMRRSDEQQGRWADWAAEQYVHWSERRLPAWRRVLNAERRQTNG